MKLVASWEEWCQVFHDQDFWVPEIESICRYHQVDLTEIEATFPGTHAVFVINQQFVLKIFCPIQYNSFSEERHFHQEMLFENPLFPKVIFSGKSESGYDYLAFEIVKGKPLRESGVQTVRPQTLDDLVDVLVWMQSKTLHRSLEGDISCLVHYDLTRDHIFLDRNARLTAVIDFGDAVISHPADEFPVLFIDAFDCNGELISGFTRRYNQRSLFYQIQMDDVQRGIERHPFRDDLLRILNDRPLVLSSKGI
jgi:hypothetical protein